MLCKINCSDASISSTPSGPQFGVDLSALVERVGGLPSVVRRCVTHIEANGLDVEGIYRLSGSAARISELAAMVDGGGELWFAAGTPIHDVCGLLKLYLRQLPEPLLTAALWRPLLAVADELEERGVDPSGRARAALGPLLARLPEANRGTLGLLLFVLTLAIVHRDTTRMSAHNAAICIRCAGGVCC